MNTDKKRGLYEISIDAVKILLFILIAFNAFVFLYYGLINRGDPIKDEPVQYVTEWTVTDKENGDQVITSTLPDNIKSSEYLYFDTRRDAVVYVNGEFRKDFDDDRDINLPGGSMKRFLMAVPLKASDSGTEIVIERKTLLDYDRAVPEVFISTRSGAVSHLLKSDGISFVLSFIVMIFSFVSFVVSIVLRVIMKQRIDMMYGALGILCIAAWIVTDSFLFPFIFKVNHVNGLLSFMYCLMIPLGLAVYLFSIQRGRYKKSMSFVLLVSIANAVVWPILHFTGILPIYNALNLANSVLVFLAVSGIAILIVDAIRGNTVSYYYTFIGFLGFLIGCLIELINVIFEILFIRHTVLIVVGLAFLLTFIVVQQVHDLRKINMEKQRAIDISEAKTKFLASMSHEIRTPINAILGMNEMILRENSDKEIEEYSRSIKSSGKMLLMLVNDVLDFTKIESGKLEIKESEFLMSDMLYDIISLIGERAEEKKLDLKTEIVDEVPNEIISDEFRIRQVLVNLMNNAVKYTDDGTIKLRVGGHYTEDGYELSLMVEDTGRGIRKEDQEHLFEAFSRADVKSNISIEGTGLGLAIVKSIVKSMNGELGVESEYGVGSKFWVKFPVKYGNKEALNKDFMKNRHVQMITTSASSFTAPDALVLVVDDNQSNLKIVKLFLKQNEIIPDICSSGTRAIELCKEKKYDLILMDHMMPEPDGIETLHIIKESADSLNKDTKAVVLTANAIAGSRQMYINEGFDDYLTKPLDVKILEDTVKKMVPSEKIIEVSGKGNSEPGGSGEDAFD
ncbi:MAG: response regulator, partial [Lachnospiraceae bacterium]|nr:response regulator [Lachnospiraceae bacterium]